MLYKIKRITLCLIIIGTSLGYAQNRSIEFDHSDWKALLEKANKENKLVFVDCFTTWCGPCKWMAKNVFTNDTVADFFNKNFINAKIDMEKGEGKDIAKQYAVQAYPTFIFVNGDGELVHRLCGSSPAKQFIESAKNALDPEKKLVSYAKKFNGGNTTGQVAYDYFTMLAAGCQSTDEPLNLYFTKQKESDYTSRIHWNIINHFIGKYDAPMFVYLESNKAAYAKLYTLDSVEMKLNAVYNQGIFEASRKGDIPAYEKMKEKVRASGTKDAEKIIARTEVSFYEKQKDWKNFASATSNYVEKYAMNEANALNNAAWSFYQNVDDITQLEKAARWSKLSCEKDDSYSNNDTYAALLYKLKKKDEATKAANKAIELAKKDGDDYSATETLLKKIKELK